MKILMTTDTVGGVWTYALELARALAAHDVHVHLATMGAPLRDDQRAEAQSAGVTLHESSYRLEWMIDPWQDVDAAGRWLLDIQRSINADLIHLNGYAHAELPWHAPTLVVGHSCVYSWWRAVHGEDPPIEWRRYRNVVTRGLAAADLVLAPTRAMLAALEQCYGPLPRAGVIANARTAAAFVPRPKEPVVFAAGRLWDQAKNLAALDAAAPHVDWPIHVAGDATSPSGDTAVAANVRCLGKLSQTQVAEQLSRAAIYALPARYEPFGLSALEAGLARCALVLGDIPSLREVWEDAAVYVSPDSPDELASAINALARESARREALANAARERALTFSPERQASAYMRAYRLLLHGAGQESKPALHATVGARSH